ncbi:MAG TPA: hypothetical protein VMJ32_12145 [Pirellulales bacterium]|nr:hypothetical protein [Pirellulales bacterium]
MRKSTFALAQTFLVAILWLGLQDSQPRAAEETKPTMQKWEYHFELSNWSNRGEATTLLN